MPGTSLTSAGTEMVNFLTVIPLLPSRPGSAAQRQAQAVSGQCCAVAVHGRLVGEYVRRLDVAVQGARRCARTVSARHTPTCCARLLALCPGFLGAVSEGVEELLLGASSLVDRPPCCLLYSDRRHCGM